MTQPNAPSTPALADLIATAAPGIVSVTSRSHRASGFVWRDDLIVTAEETLPEDGALAVTLNDGRSLAATLVGRDPSTDIALLRVPGVPGSVSWSSEAARAGAPIVALGAVEEAALATTGIVSLASGPWRSLRDGAIDRRIELGVRLDPRAEGGLALGADGAAIGMTVSGPRRRVLVIPHATIERVAPLLRDHGRIPRGHIGVAMQPVRIDGAEASGLILLSVLPGGPAATAGLLQGDIILRWKGEPVAHVRKLRRQLDPGSVGDTLDLTVSRGGTLHDVAVTIGLEPDRAA